MLIPCEIAVKSVIPAIKALMAKELVEKHGLKQDEVAKLLGMSQPAISKYTRKVRGNVIKIDEIEELQPIIGKMTHSVMNGNYQRDGFLEIFCQVCMVIRRTGLMCQFCQQTDPNIKVQECSFCKLSDL